MKIIFAGTPEFAATALSAIIANGHEVVAVLTQPDRPAGRGMQLQASPVKRLAQEHHVLVLQPQSLQLQNKDPILQKEAEQILYALDQMDFDAMVVVAYGLILPEAFLQIAKRADRRGAFNIHASLLPRWRGAAPIQRAIEAGDMETGVAIMEMEAGLDTGPILLQEAILIAPNETSQTLHNRLASLGADLIVRALKFIAQTSNFTTRVQDEKGVTYAHKILKAESRLDWSLPSVQLDRKVRAFNPSPGATTEFDGELLKVWATRIPRLAKTVSNVGPGTILGEGEQGILVQCGDFPLEITELQKAGGKKMAARLWLLGRPESVGRSFT